MRDVIIPLLVFAVVTPNEKIILYSVRFDLARPFLNEIIPTLLEFSPLPQTREEQLGPFNGRRLLTFTDSRQGTARISARLQQDADKATLRALCYRSWQILMSHQQSSARHTAHC